MEVRTDSRRGSFTPKQSSAGSSHNITTATSRSPDSNRAGARSGVLHLRALTRLLEPVSQWLPQPSSEKEEKGCGDEQTLQQTYSRVSGSARCVQNFDDSLSFAIRMTYRISLRSSSLWEPRHPLLKVFYVTYYSLPSSPRRTLPSTISSRSRCFVSHHTSRKWIIKGGRVLINEYQTITPKCYEVHGSYLTTATPLEAVQPEQAG